MNSEEIKVEPLKEPSNNFKQLKEYVFQNQKKKKSPPGLNSAGKSKQVPSFTLPYNFPGFPKPDIEIFNIRRGQMSMKNNHSRPAKQLYLPLKKLRKFLITHFKKLSCKTHFKIY